MFNRSWSTRDVSVDLTQIGFKTGAHIRDVWKEKDLGEKKGIVVDTLPKWSATLLIVGK
jgi:alpha-galactosidase